MPGGTGSSRGDADWAGRPRARVDLDHHRPLRPHDRVLDEANPGLGWRAAPSMQIGRGHHNTVLLPDGSMVTVGGGVGIRNGDQWAADPAQRQVDLWNPATGTWSSGTPKRSRAPTTPPPSCSPTAGSSRPATTSPAGSTATPRRSTNRPTSSRGPPHHHVRAGQQHGSGPASPWTPGRERHRGRAGGAGSHHTRERHEPALHRAHRRAAPRRCDADRARRAPSSPPRATTCSSCSTPRAFRRSPSG